MDELSVKLNNSTIGCNVNDTMTNHLFYTGDSVLLVPTASDLQSLLDICVNITHNVKT